MKNAHLVLAVIAGGVLSPLPAQAQTPSGEDVQLPPSPPGSEPIIPESAFEEALPPLDPELDAPLEPIEEFEAQPIENIGEPPFPPVPGPVEDAPLGDPALAEPLPPLSTFEVQTPEMELAKEEAEPAPIRYTLQVEGLEEVGLRDEFMDLSALRDARGEAENGAMLRARAEEDEALAVRLLRAEGYYDAIATSSVEQAPDEPGLLRATIAVVPGERYSFGNIEITGPSTVPKVIARDALELQTGEPIEAAEVLAAEANVLLRLPQQGYPFPEIGMRDIVLDPETQTGDYTLPLDPGPRARFGGFVTEGDIVFGPEHIDVLARFEPGELYDRRLVDDLREAMIATQLFDAVSAEPVLTGEEAPDGTEYVNILVRPDAGPPRSLTASAGYSTGEGLRIEGGWEHRNLFPPEGSLRVSAIAGTQEQALLVRFRRSNWRQRDRALLLLAEAGRRDYEAFEGYMVRLHGLVTRESTPIWQKRWTYAYGAEILATNESRFGSARVSFRDAYYIAGLIGEVGYDASNDLLNPTRGFRVTARVNPEAQHQLGDTYRYVRNLVDGSAYYPVGEDLVLAGRVRFGSIYGIPRDALAPSRRLYAGGGGSVRGFGYQELGPREEAHNPKFDPENPDDHPPTIFVPLGGRSLNEFSIEGRYRFGNYGVVAFVDAGQVYDSEYPRFDDLRFGVGVGARIYTNFGPVRVDVATPINRREGESRISVYVSIGQAF